MNKIKYNPLLLQGNWKKGFALDEYSKVDGTGKLIRTQIGEQLHLVKYEGNLDKIKPLAETVIKFLSKKIFTMFLSAIIPVPPSNTKRAFQPVYEIAKLISRDFGIEFADDIIIKNRPTPETKDFIDKGERIKNLVNAFRIDSLKLADKNVLLFDDVFQSGATVHCVTDVLYDQGKVQNVYLLTLTRVGG